MMLLVLNRKYFLIGHFRDREQVNTNTDLNTVDLKSLNVDWNYFSFIITHCNVQKKWANDEIKHARHKCRIPVLAKNKGL